MSDNKTEDRYVVVAGSVQICTTVGAGRAWKDFHRGDELPGDVTDADLQQLVTRGAIAKADADGNYEISDGDWYTLHGDTPRPTVAVRPVPGIVEPDEIDPDIVPAGSPEQILAWVGGDLARARVARHEEQAKGNDARASVLAALDEVMASVETTPPAVPEHLVDEGKIGGTADPGDIAPAAVDNPTEHVGDTGATAAATAGTPSATVKPAAKKTAARKTAGSGSDK